RERDAARVVPGLPQGGQVVVVPVPGVAAVGELLLRRNRVPRVPGRPDLGRLARLRARPPLLVAAALPLRADRHADPRAHPVALSSIGRAGIKTCDLRTRAGRLILSP